MPGGPLPRRDADRAGELDRRPRAGRGRRHHDLPRLADHRRGDAGARRGSDWQSDVPREVTIQVVPAPGRDIEAECAKAAAIARASPGVAEVRPYTKEESAKLLEPWLGTGLALDDLPVPRLIVVKIAPGATPDLAAAAQDAGRAGRRAPSLDDHRGWVDRMRTMAGTAVVAGICILVLVLAATVLSVAFATRGAMATNRPIIEVLHFVGAEDGFIAGQFQRHFLLLGLQGRRASAAAPRSCCSRSPARSAAGSPARRRRPGRGPVRHLFDRDRAMSRSRLRSS